MSGNYSFWIVGGARGLRWSPVSIWGHLEIRVWWTSGGLQFPGARAGAGATATAAGACTHRWRRPHLSTRRRLFGASGSWAQWQSSHLSNTMAPEAIKQAKMKRSWTSFTTAVMLVQTSSLLQVPRAWGSSLFRPAASITARPLFIDALRRPAAAIMLSTASSTATLLSPLPPPPDR